MAASNIHSAADARQLAKRRLPWMIFDYIDGAAGSEVGADRGRLALDAVTLRPKILRDVSVRDTSVDLFGKRAAVPFGDCADGDVQSVWAGRGFDVGATGGETWHSAWGVDGGLDAHGEDP